MVSNTTIKIITLRNLEHNNNKTTLMVSMYKSFSHNTDEQRFVN